MGLLEARFWEAGLRTLRRACCQLVLVYLRGGGGQSGDFWASWKMDQLLLLGPCQQEAAKQEKQALPPSSSYSVSL